MCGAPGSRWFLWITYRSQREEDCGFELGACLRSLMRLGHGRFHGPGSVYLFFVKSSGFDYGRVYLL